MSTAARPRSDGARGEVTGYEGTVSCLTGTGAAQHLLSGEEKAYRLVGMLVVTNRHLFSRPPAVQAPAAACVMAPAALIARRPPAPAHQRLAGCGAAAKGSRCSPRKRLCSGESCDGRPAAEFIICLLLGAALESSVRQMAP